MPDLSDTALYLLVAFFIVWTIDSLRLKTSTHQVKIIDFSVTKLGTPTISFLWKGSPVSIKVDDSTYKALIHQFTQENKKIIEIRVAKSRILKRLCAVLVQKQFLYLIPTGKP